MLLVFSQSKKMKSTAWISTKKVTGLQQVARITAFVFMTAKLWRFVTLYAQHSDIDTFDFVYIISQVTILESYLIFCKTGVFCFLHVVSLIYYTISDLNFKNLCLILLQKPAKFFFLLAIMILETLSCCNLTIVSPRPKVSIEHYFARSADNWL